MMDVVCWANAAMLHCYECLKESCGDKLLKTGFLGDNSTTEYYTTKSYASFHSELTVDSNDINFSFG